MSSLTSQPQQSAEQHASAALANYLDDGHALEEAISAFTRPVSSLVCNAVTDESSLEQPVQDLWAAIISRARTTPSSSSHQDRLVTFLTHLKSSNVPGNSNPQLWGASLWAELPMFGASMREAWNSGPSNDTNIPIRSEALLTAKVDNGTSEWVNINAFAARLTASRTADFSLYAIWTMRDALETPAARTKNKTLDGHVQAGCAWIQYAGEYLYQCEESWEKDPRKGDPARGGSLWEGKSGFCKERWSLWRERIEELGKEKGLQEETRKAATGAAERMRQLEGR